VSASEGTLHCGNNPLLLFFNLLCFRTGTNDLALAIGENISPIHLDSEQYLFPPWTHEPVCTKVLPSTGSYLCVYTNSIFRKGRGISIFTTSQIANTFAALLPFHGPLSESVNPSNGPWYTKHLARKGTGMLASYELHRGDLITYYTPALIVHIEQDLSLADRENYLRIAINQLPRETRETYFGLSKIYGHPDFLIQDVIEANTFEMQIGGGGGAYGSVFRDFTNE
jgi:hypothetical protein